MAQALKGMEFMNPCLDYHYHHWALGRAPQGSGRGMEPAGVREAEDILWFYDHTKTPKELPWLNLRRAFTHQYSIKCTPSLCSP